MKIGLQIPSFTWPGGAAEIAPQLAAIARTAEDVGFASVWVMDHFFQIDFIGAAEEPMLEGYTTLAYLAAHTKRVSLGTLVTGVTYRRPGLLAKTVTTLDVLSGGRAWLGIGAAWYEREHLGLGVPFPPIAERFEHLEDALRIFVQMGSGEVAAFEGTHATLAETLNQPPPLSRPRPRILIGGGGEQKTLRLVARYADAWNIFDYIGRDELTRKRDVLRAHCDEIGRDFSEIECTTLGTVNPRSGQQSSREILDSLKGLADAGFSHAIVNIPDVHELAVLETLGKDVIPEVAGW